MYQMIGIREYGSQILRNIEDLVLKKRQQENPYLFQRRVWQEFQVCYMYSIIEEAGNIYKSGISEEIGTVLNPELENRIAKPKYWRLILEKRAARIF